MNTKQTQTVLAVIVVLVLVAAAIYYFLPKNAAVPGSSTATSTGATTTPAASRSAGTKTSTAGTGAAPANTSTVSYAPSTAGVSLVVSPTSGTAPLTAKFVGTFPVSLNGSYTFSLAYGDGTSPEAVPASCVGATCTVNATHVYKISGTFAPELSAVTKCASTAPPAADCPHESFAIATAAVTVTGGESDATLSISPTTATVSTPVTMIVEGSGSALKLDFGDGTSDSLAPMTAGSVTLSHTYASAGTYVVKVTSGTQTFTTQNVIIRN